MAHVYDIDGVSHFHLTPAKAKAQGLFFSVTEHQKVLAKPALEIWKVGEAIKAAKSHRPRDDEDDASYVRRIKSESYSSSAADLGTSIHDAIQKVLEGNKTVEELEPKLQPFVRPAINYFEVKGFKDFALEKTVVNVNEGYAGTVDCAATAAGGQLFVLDWKSRKTSPKYKKLAPYDGQPEQVAAYAAAFYGEDQVEAGKVWGANAFISTTETDEDGDARFEVVSYTPDEMKHHFETFKLVAELWRRANKYDPRVN
jgi:hypothetical protein